MSVDGPVSSLARVKLIQEPDDVVPHSESDFVTTTTEDRCIDS